MVRFHLRPPPTANKNMKRALQYRRMYETKNVRPYYTIPHLGGFGNALKELVGFGYKNSIYITSPEMNNEGYHEVQEMKRATEHFRKIWLNRKKTNKILRDIKQVFKEAMIAETYARHQKWRGKSTEDLLHERNIFFDLLYRVITRMLVSQPQHVLSLEQRMDALLEKFPNKSQLLSASTFFSGELPWFEEEKRIAKLHAAWGSMSHANRRLALDSLVEKYGWFNEIEGDRSFDRKHYQEKIVNYHRTAAPRVQIRIPPEVRKVGKLIGELGFLRFWNRYHFMTVRYHLRNILAELIVRSGKPDLEFATTREVGYYFKGWKMPWGRIRARKHGYASYLKNGETCIVIGSEARKLKQAVNEDVRHTKKIVGSIANKGLVQGRVRVISFSASDYSKQVEAFKKGEILVTGMTRPQIVHLCKIAAAIVTDEGGITSHAAVISREFNIPCVIATHNATRLLKTGDIVQVDANNGIIRKLF